MLSLGNISLLDVWIGQLQFYKRRERRAFSVVFFLFINNGLNFKYEWPLS